MGEWQDISTAPKDGTPIDLWHKIGFRITDVWWDIEDDVWSCLMLDEDFTHWMPLPEPPVSK